jgi:hemoglobin
MGCEQSVTVNESSNVKSESDPLPSKTTLYDQLGGQEAVNAAVDIFYTKVLADDRIKHFFTSIDMLSLRSHQKRFLSYAFGGMPNYSGKSMREAHGHLVKEMGLTDSHFDAVVENLALALRELNVSESLISQVAAVAESVRNDILDR